MHTFSVGDKVVKKQNIGNACATGVIKRISPKRGDITVDFGNYTETFNSMGRSKNHDIWYGTYIEPLTPEIEHEIYVSKLLFKCRKTFENTKLTEDKAKRILEILEE